MRRGESKMKMKYNMEMEKRGNEERKKWGKGGG